MNSRRDFIKKATLLAAGLGVSQQLPASIIKALEINPALGSTFMDAEHVVFLMQENRSFDHVFGTLKGVRGFNDPRAIKLPNNNPVWLQSNKKGETYAPFRMDIKNTKITWMESLPHSWENQVDARNNGKYDQWLETKKSGVKEYQEMPLTLGYYNRQDVPFYYAMADAFTVCDQYFCSSLTGTSPNRCYFWTGTILEKQNENAMAHLINENIDKSEHLTWSTFPEKLSKHNIDWKVYQNELSVGVNFEENAEDWLANFGDNDLEYFKQFHVKNHPEHLVYLKQQKIILENKIKENPNQEILKQLNQVIADLEYLKNNPIESFSEFEQDLHKRAFVTNKNDPNYHKLETVNYKENGKEHNIKVPKGDILHQFRTDVDSGKLPTVSWLVPPCNFSDHPCAPWYGAWYLSEVISILTKNPEVWKKTIFILNYDENDGYFDHVPPFVAPNPKDASTGKVSSFLNIDTEFISKNKSTRESSIGLGYRVPMIVVSPWSRGGYVNSQVFDHTSTLQFLENFLSKKTGKKIVEDNISSWRRSLCGNLTSAFRPYHGEEIILPKKIEQKPFIKSIYNAKFEKTPDNFKKLLPEEISEIKKNPNYKNILPIQEPGVKPSNSIPYEIYVSGNINKNKTFEIQLEAGNKIFGKKSSGVGFLVYNEEKNWSFTVAAGEKLNYYWDLKSFKDKNYNLKIYSVNGYFRHFKGNEYDPKINIEVGYDANGIILKIKRTEKDKKIQINITHKSYYYKSKSVVLEQNKTEITIPIYLKSSHNWYDFIVSVAGFNHFSQQFAGHVDNEDTSFTDSLMGRV